METKRKATLFGLGFDHQDEHLRITRGPNFVLMGGSKPTHERMQETAIKINEKLRKRGKTLDNVTPAEFTQITEEVGLKPLTREDHKKREEPDEK